MRRFLVFVMAWFSFGPAFGAPLPPLVAEAIASDPAGFLDEASVIILGFGGPEGIDRDGLERMVAVEAAGMRAQSLRRLGVADLDGDDLITLAEAQASASIASARVRGRLLRDFEKADADGNKSIERREALTYAQAEAARLIARRAEAILSLMAFDEDGDGWVSTDDLKRGIARSLAAAGHREGADHRDGTSALPMPI